MKANEFIKEHGLQYTKNLVRDYPNHTHVTDDGRMFINENTCAAHIKFQLGELVRIADLKRLIESHELVESAIEWHGDIVAVKNYIENVDSGLKHGVYFKCAAKKTKDNNDKLKQAIADVESCMDVSHE